MRVRDILSRAGGPTPLVGLALILTTLWPAPARAEPSEPVQALDRALLQLLPPGDPNDKDWAKKALKERKDKLTELTDDKSQLTGLSDMAQALLLTSWGDERPSLTDLPDTNKVDGEVREALLQRFLAGVKKILRAGGDSGDATLRDAVATLVGEYAASARSGFLGSRASNRLLVAGLPAFADTLAALAKSDKSAEVRAAAARALAKVRSDPDVTVAALEDMLKDTDPEVRRAAADALAALMQGTRSADRGALAAPAAEARGDTLIPFGPKVARAAGAVLGSRERDAAVRRSCSEALSQVAQILNTQLRATEAPRKLHETLRPVRTALWDQTGALGAAAQDADADVRYPALRALEEMGEIRRRWLHPEEFIEGLPTPEGRPLKPPILGAATPLDASGLILTSALEQVQPPAEEPAPLAAAIPALVRALGNNDVHTRLAAIDTLESITAHSRDQTAGQELGKQPASEAAKGLTRALYDRDRYVRWAAARTLGKMAPLDDVENGKRVEHGAVAGLTLLLADADPDVRLRVAYALERFGKAAADAIPGLAVAVSRGDDEVRIAAAHAIEVIGGSPDAAVPALVAGLDSTNTRLRRGVAEALAKYGAQARAGKPALQRALHDPDAEVRRLASDALIKIGTAK